MEDAGGVIILALELGVEVLLIGFIADICDLSPGQKPMPTRRINTMSPWSTLSVVET